MKSILPVVAVVAVAAFAIPAVACERHQSHATLTTAEQVAPAPPPQVVIEPAAQSAPALGSKALTPMSSPLGAAYEGCNRARKGETVYLTQ